MSASTTSLFGLLVVLTGAGCPDSSRNPDGGAEDARSGDGLGLADAFIGGISVNFSVADCPGTQGSDAAVALGCCRGPAPLTLTFVPVTAGPIDRFLWSFGDGTAPNHLQTPSHTYTLPDRYDVTLVAGGPAGSLSETKAGCIEATANAIGRSCEVDVQCQAGSTCLCGAAGQCTAPFSRGICSASCRDTPCLAPSQCADLSLGGPASPEAPWRQAICLASCQSDGECSAGLKCRDVPGPGPTRKWIKACFPSFPLAIGSPCRNAGGRLSSAACISGLCANRGALGQCSLHCSAGPCPEGSTCASFNNGEKLCVPVCSSKVMCLDDALLSCQIAGGSGPLSFTVPEPSSAATYCVPKVCQTDEQCPGGSCLRAGGSGRCLVPAP